MDEISYSGANSIKRRKLSKRGFMFLGFFLIVVLLLGGVFYFVTKSGSKKEETKSIQLPEVSETPIETTSPTESLSPSVSPTPTKAASTSVSNDIKVAVQNGSGEAGVAGAASSVLKDAGYSVVSTGNADNFDYTDVTIQVKSSKKKILADLESALSKKYTIGDTSTDLPETTSYDALVIIGK